MRFLRLILLPLVFVACTDQQPVALDDAEGPAFSKGAVLRHGVVDCGVIDGTGAFFPSTASGELIPCGTEVATFSENGNAKATAQAFGVPNPTGETVRWGPYNPGWEMAAMFAEIGIEAPPYPCIVYGTGGAEDYLFTVKWHAMVTPSGHATISCHYSKKWEYQWP
jgi:hypothetical protein